MKKPRADLPAPRLLRAGALIAGLAAASPGVWADGHAYDVANPAYRSECGSCHVPYPPALLPAAAWEKMMAGLNKHFGTDASLDAASAREVSDFLARNAGRSRGRKHDDHEHEREHSRDRDRASAGDANTLRISETRWFQHEHSEDLSPAVWKNPKVKSPANCGACHTRAEQGDYGERSLRVPR
ncbi:MAG: diheme cytochrome c [Rhodocyclaceae bacterium]